MRYLMKDRITADVRQMFIAVRRLITNCVADAERDVVREHGRGNDK